MKPRTAPEILEDILEYISHAGRVDKVFMETQGGGLETPLIMADISCNQPINVVGRGPSYQGVDLSSDIHHFTGGEVIISVEENKPPGIFFYAAQVQVSVRIANQPNVLATAVVNNGTGPLVVPIPLNQAYTYLGISVRQLVNGVPSADIFPANPLMAGASMFLSYSGRLYR